MFEQIRIGYYYHMPQWYVNLDRDLKVEIEWRFMLYVYVENKLWRHTHTYLTASPKMTPSIHLQEPDGTLSGIPQGDVE